MKKELTASEKLVQEIQKSFSDYHREQLSMRIKRGIAVKRAKVIAK